MVGRDRAGARGRCWLRIRTSTLSFPTTACSITRWHAISKSSCSMGAASAMAGCCRPALARTAVTPARFHRRQCAKPADGACRRHAIRMQLAGEFAERLTDRSHPLPWHCAGTRQLNRRIVAAAGIGNPGRFFTMLRGAGLELRRRCRCRTITILRTTFCRGVSRYHPDHREGCSKMSARLNLKNDPRLWVVPVTARIDCALAEQIVEKCRGCSTA